jgi:hypothetical protein
VYLNNDPCDLSTAMGAGSGPATFFPEDRRGRVQAEPPASGTEQLGSDVLLAFLSDFRSPQVVQEPEDPAQVRSTETTLGFGVASGNPDAHLDDPYAGSEAQLGADWWLASDGRWYAPELHPDRQANGAVEAEEPAPAVAAVQAAVSVDTSRPARAWPRLGRRTRGVPLTV